MNLKCPITGGNLIYDYTEPMCMDPESFYHSETNPEIRFSTHPFIPNVYFQVDKYGNSFEGRRVFKHNAINQWKEYKEIREISKLVPIDTPQSEIDAAIKISNEEREKRLLEYERAVAAGDIKPWPGYKKITNGLISNEKVEVQPMSPPSSNLFFLDSEIE